MELYLDSTDRHKKIIKLLNNNNPVAETEVVGDLLTEIENLLKRENVLLSEIKEVKVNPGPGSFTSLRLGLSLANAINYALNPNNPPPPLLPIYGREPSITRPKEN